jgi:hypothetical protein
MLGQLVFAEIPFASIGQPPYIERGWIKECPETNLWSKMPTEVSSWQRLDKASNDWSKAAAKVSSWQVVDRSNSDWDEQPSNDVNTIGCGYVPSNLGGKQ